MLLAKLCRALGHYEQTRRSRRLELGATVQMAGEPMNDICR
ncbi:hypothetical protein [Scytonema sp. PCC 10023]